MVLDTGYTKGYKRSDNKKTSGSRNHFFARFNKNFIDEDKENSNLEIDIQKVSKKEPEMEEESQGLMSRPATIKEV